MIIRALTGDGDFRFGSGKQDYNRENNAIAENVQTRLLSFLNDCFFDLQAGIDWFRLLSDKGTLEQVKLDVRAVILGTEGVVQINSLEVQMNDLRRLQLTYEIDTIYTKKFTQNLEVLNG